MSPHIHHLFIPSLEKETQSDSLLADLVLLHPWLKFFLYGLSTYIMAAMIQGHGPFW